MQIQIQSLKEMLFTFTGAVQLQNRLLGPAKDLGCLEGLGIHPRPEVVHGAPVPRRRPVFQDGLETCDKS